MNTEEVTKTEENKQQENSATIKENTENEVSTQETPPADSDAAQNKPETSMSDSDDGEEKPYKTFKSKDDYQQAMNDAMKSYVAKNAKLNTEKQALEAEVKQLKEKIAKTKFTTKIVYVDRKVETDTTTKQNGGQP